MEAGDTNGIGDWIVRAACDGCARREASKSRSSADWHALDAAVAQRRRIAELSASRAASGLPVTHTHVAPHVGELLYGNLGSARRLDFTVLGPAVNEAARIESLCASLDQTIIVSQAFADQCDACQRLVSLGRYAMKGVARPQELFTPDVDCGQ